MITDYGLITAAKSVREGLVAIADALREIAKAQESAPVTMNATKKLTKGDG